MGSNMLQPNIAVVCGDDKVRIINLDYSSIERVDVIWQWQIDEAAKQLPPEYQQYLYPLDECKFVDNNKKLLIAGSSGAVILLDIETRQCLFHAYAPMAHSAELMPDERVVLALSVHNSGNRLQLYDLNKSDRVLFHSRLFFGHAVLWDASTEILYALGFSKLRAYQLKQWETAEPVLERIHSWDLPFNAGHDMCRYNSHELLVSGREGVFIFNLIDYSFKSFAPLAEVKSIKSINYDAETDRLLYTKGEIEWWTHHIYQENPKQCFTINDMRIYKVRMAMPSIDS